MPRELLLPIPHAIADKVHHLLSNHSLDLIDLALQAEDKDHSNHQSLVAQGREFKQLADKLDTLARKAGVMGW